MPRILPVTQPINGGFSSKIVSNPPATPEGSPGTTPMKSPLTTALPETVSQAESAARNKTLRSIE